MAQPRHDASTELELGPRATAETRKGRACELPVSTAPASDLGADPRSLQTPTGPMNYQITAAIHYLRGLRDAPRHPDELPPRFWRGMSGATANPERDDKSRCDPPSQKLAGLASHKMMREGFGQSPDARRSTPEGFSQVPPGLPRILTGLDGYRCDGLARPTRRGPHERKPDQRVTAERPLLHPFPPATGRASYP